MSDIARLFTRIAELEEENRQLREALTPTIRLPSHWKLSPQEAAFLLTLYGSSGIVRFEAISFAISRTADPVSDQHISVLVSKIRRKLAQSGVAIRITNRWGVGYRLDDLSRAVIASALADFNSERRAA